MSLPRYDLPRSVGLLVALALNACDPAGERAPVAVERDSAGVAVVEASPPYERWTLDPTPTVRIGVLSGRPEDQLSEVAHAARLADGRIVLIDGGSSEVRWYGPDGRFQARAGGPGEGPGELRRVTAATLTPGDTLVVYDPRNGRLSWFSPEGAWSRALRIDFGAGSSIGLHPLGDGRLLIAEERLVHNFGAAEYNAARDSLLLLISSGASESVDTVMRLPGREAITWVNYVNGRPTGTRQMEVPFGSRPLVAGVSDRIVLVGAGREEVAFFGPGGGLERLVRRSDVRPPEVSASLREAYVAQAVEGARAGGGPGQGAGASAARASAEARLEFVPEGRPLPAFDRLLVDASPSRIWIRDYLPEWRANDLRLWTVHDLSGRVLAQVATPEGFQVTQVTSGQVVGIETDSMGVEYVAVYAVP